jgi:hypothetical protein
MLEEILVLHHSHTDIGFTHPQPVWWELSRRYIDEALDLCEATAGWPEASRMRWTCENTLPVVHWLERASSRQIDRFRQLAQAGQVSVAGLPCNLLPITDLEQLTVGLQPVRRLRNEFGIPIKAAILHDVNGIVWPLTQLLLDLGIELLIMGINTHYGGYPLSRPLAFRWQGMDGRPLLCFNGVCYTYFDKVANMHERSVEAMARGVAEYMQNLPADYPYDFAFLTATHRPFLNDNNPPNPDLPRLIRQWNAEGRQPLIRLVTPEMFLERLRDLPAAIVPTHAGDWTDHWPFGVGSAAFGTRVGQAVRSRLAAADLARVATQRGGAEDPARRQRALDALILWAEHTWDADVSLTHPASDVSSEQRAHKFSYLYQARSETAILLRDQLETMAGNPLHAHGLAGLLVFNPAPTAHRSVLRVPDQFFTGSWAHFTGNILRLDQQLELLEADERGVLVGPVDVPAYGWRTVPLDDLRRAEVPQDTGSGDTWLESPSFRLDFDAASGRILRLRDKMQGWQLLDPTSPWDFAGLVHETVDPARHRVTPPPYGHDAYFDLDWRRMEQGENCWRGDWPAQRCGPDRLLECRAWCTPRGATLLRRWQGAGVEDLEQRITLLAHRPVVEISASFRLPERLGAEAYYLTFPLDLPGWRAHYDTAELPVEFDREQLPGACRGWLCVSRWVSLHNAQHSITLCCPDAPLVQIGGFNWARPQPPESDRHSALLLAWLTNNYWNCNYPASQPGTVRFRYELHAGGPFDATASTIAGLTASHPVEMHPVLGDRLSTVGQIIHVAGDGVVLLHAQPGMNGTRASVRLANLTDRPTQAEVHLPGCNITSAVSLDTLGQPRATVALQGGAAFVQIPARALAVFALHV